MNKTLKDLRVQSMYLYNNYQTGLYTLEEYQEQIKPLDDSIDELELQTFTCHLLDTLAS